MKYWIIYIGLVLSIVLSGTSVLCAKTQLLSGERKDSTTVIVSVPLEEYNAKVTDLENRIRSLEHEKENRKDFITKSEVKRYVLKITCIVVGCFVLITAIIAIVLIKYIYKFIDERLRNELYKKIRQEIKQSLSEVKYSKSAQEDQKLKEKVEKTIDKVEKAVDEVKRIKEDIYKQRSIKTEEPVVTSVKAETILEEKKSVYASPMDGLLREIPDLARAYYVIEFNSNSNIGIFKICNGQEQIQRAIMNKEDILDRFCNSKGSVNTANSIRIVEAGKVERISTGTWKVIQKAEIEFIS